MSWLRNRSIGGKLGILAAIPLVLLMVMMVFNFVAFSKVDARYTYAYENFAVFATEWTMIRTNTRGIQGDIAKLILLDNTEHEKEIIKEITDDIRRRRAENTDIMERYKKTSIPDRERVILGRIESMMRDLDVIQDKNIEMSSGGASDAEAVRYFIEEVDPFLTKLIYDINEMSDTLIDETKRVQHEASNYSWGTAVTGAAVTILATVVTLIMSFVISRMITSPLNAIKENTDLFANGDLTVVFESRGRDAIAEMGSSLEKMGESLRGVVNVVKSAGNRISDSAENFSALAQQTNAAVEEFRVNVEEMSANLGGLASLSESVNASVQEVAAGAQTTAEKGADIARKVDDAMNAGDAGMNAVHSVVDGIGRVAESSAASTSAVLELGNRTRQIQGFVSQIGSIADQTNLLALNAAIEAARAGEAGRGFAVVAEEVRKLAEDSNAAAKNIAELASIITSDLDKIVEFAQENTTDSNRAKELSAETETAITNMIAYLKDIAGSTQDLAAVAQEQAASSEEIAESVQGMSTRISDTAGVSDGIKTSVTEIASASEKIASDSEKLSALSSDLQEELEFFNVGDDERRQENKKGLKALRSAT